MITGQLVTVTTYYAASGRLAYKGTGQVVGFVASSAPDGFGAVHTTEQIVVLCTDGRFRFVAPVDVRALELPAALAEVA